MKQQKGHITNRSSATAMGGRKLGLAQYRGKFGFSPGGMRAIACFNSVPKIML